MGKVLISAKPLSQIDEISQEPFSVITAKAGIHGLINSQNTWTPVFTGGAAFF